MGKKILIGVLVLLGLILVAAAGLWGYFHFVIGPQTAELTNTKPKDLNADEIKAKLASPVFSEKLAGRQQLAKLEVPDRIAVLRSIVKDENASVRLMAVTELKKIADPAAVAILREVATSDADADVKSAAEGK
ncbi:MAG: HEAT repeat domain-containing protein [Planctomycetes bacterium]|nr:HEAT repeat domain-containing protein [Planctomycetota bacterium]